MTERFWSKVDVSAPNECWEWTAGRNSTGYGTFRIGRDMRGAHRVAYELSVGPIPEGLQIDHLCRNVTCVNPAHLEPVTQRENSLRGVSPAAVNATKTHCPKGHEYTPENTEMDSGGRRCRICRRDYEVNRRPKRRAMREAA